MYPNGLVALSISAGMMRLDLDDLSETSIARTLMSGQRESEKWMIFTHTQYLAPEVLRKLGMPVDARADIFSVGCVLYEALTGRTPVLGSDFLSKVHQILAVEPRAVDDLAPGIPKELSRIVSKCLEKSPCDRYMNVKSLRYDLEQLLQALQTNVDPTAGPLVDVGAMDHFSRFQLTDDLLGVEECITAMKAVLGDTSKDELSVVSISGSSGTGKTALACSIRGEVEVVGGKMCIGKVIFCFCFSNCCF